MTKPGYRAVPLAPNSRPASTNGLADPAIDSEDLEAVERGLRANAREERRKERETGKGKGKGKEEEQDGLLDAREEREDESDEEGAEMEMEALGRERGVVRLDEIARDKGSWLEQIRVSGY